MNVGQMVAEAQLGEFHAGAGGGDGRHQPQPDGAAGQSVLAAGRPVPRQKRRRAGEPDRQRRRPAALALRADREPDRQRRRPAAQPGGADVEPDRQRRRFAAQPGGADIETRAPDQTKINSDIAASQGLANTGDSMNKANVANFNLLQSAGAGQSMQSQNDINAQMAKFNQAFNYPQQQLGTLESSLGMTPHDTTSEGS